jgi:hypothetical protein
MFAIESGWDLLGAAAPNAGHQDTKPAMDLDEAVVK